METGLGFWAEGAKGVLLQQPTPLGYEVRVVRHNILQFPHLCEQ